MEDFAQTELVEPDHPVYRAGGPVCRISERGGEGKTFDYMLCDLNVCEECGGEEDADDTIVTGWPFVHSCDTTRGARKATLFRPHRPGHGSLEITVEGYQRYVQFETEEGLKTVRVRICGYAGCSVCVGTSARP